MTTRNGMLFEAPLAHFEEEQGQAWGEFESSSGYRSLAAAAADPLLAGMGGNYTIRWPKHCTTASAYTGETNNLQRRLQNHAWNLSHLGIDPAKYQVRITNRQQNPNSKLAKRARKGVQERSIASVRRKGRSLTNQQSKEYEYLFEALPEGESEAEFSQWLRKTARALGMAAGIGLSSLPSPAMQDLGQAIATAVSRTTKEGDEMRQRATKYRQRDRGSAG